ncbi:MAG: response regulator [Caulobacteraceae bacterium]
MEAHYLPHHAEVLVAEDEPFIAFDLATTIEDAGGVVVGPAATVKEALALLENHHVAAAILDVNLGDGDISPVAELLIARGAPVIFHTGLGLPAELSARFPNLIVHLKPLVPERLIRQLAALIGPGTPPGVVNGGGRAAASAE